MTQCLVKQSLPAFSILLSPYSQLLIQRELGVVTRPDWLIKLTLQSKNREQNKRSSLTVSSSFDDDAKKVEWVDLKVFCSRLNCPPPATLPSAKLIIVQTYKIGADDIRRGRVVRSGCVGVTQPKHWSVSPFSKTAFWHKLYNKEEDQDQVLPWYSFGY